MSSSFGMSVALFVEVKVTSLVHSGLSKGKLTRPFDTKPGTPSFRMVEKYPLEVG